MEAPRVPPSESLRFRVRRATRWSDEDNQGVVNNAVYLTLLEEARHAYFTELGLLEANQFPFVLAQTNLVFVAPGTGGVELEVELATVHLGRTSFSQVYRVHEVEGGRVLCEAEARLVCWDNAARTKVPMSSSFRRAVAEREGLPAEEPA